MPVPKPKTVATQGVIQASALAGAGFRVPPDDLEGRTPRWRLG